MTYIVDELGTDLYRTGHQMARYRSAEPEKTQMMICAAKADGRCKDDIGIRCRPHPHMDVCEDTGWFCGTTGISGPCIPVPSPAPVREIDRVELQRRIDNVRPYLLGVERDGKNLPLHSLPAYGLGLLADLEDLADGKARVRGRELVSGASTVIFASQEAFEEAASEWARNENWKEPR